MPFDGFIGNETAILSKPAGRLITLARVSDGVKFSAVDCGTFGDSTPVADNGIVYVTDKFKGWNTANVAFTAVRGASLPLPPLK